MDTPITFRDLSFSQKLEHIWTYYRVPIIAAVLGIILLVSLVQTLSNDTQPLLNVIMVDSNANAHGDAAPFDAFLKDIGAEPYEGAVSLNTNISFYSEEELERLGEMERNQAVLDNYDKEQMLFTLMAAGNGDVFFGKGEIFMSYARQGMLRNLEEVLSPELLEAYKEKLIYVEEEGVSYPCAVSLSHNPWLEENGYYTECCFGLLHLGKNPETAARFAEFLLRS